MYSYLLKKISLPNETKLHCVAWNVEDGWISCGGDKGLLKIIKLDDSDPQIGIIVVSNETFQGHIGRVNKLAWNTQFCKLASADENGRIIVWSHENGSWCDEMINDTNPNVVRDMQWTRNGHQICIAYDDGTVIVGSVNGEKKWAKQLEITIQFLTWSPDSNTIIFVTRSNEIKLFDNNGNFIRDLLLNEDKPLLGNMGLLASVSWCLEKDTHGINDTQAVAVAFDSGKILFIPNITGTSFNIIETGMNMLKCVWDPSFHFLCVSGCVNEELDGRILNTIKYYDRNGRCHFSMNVPGNDSITDLSWDGKGLKLAIIVDCSIYITKIKHPYKFVQLESTLVYLSSKLESTEVVYFNFKRDERHVQSFHEVLSINGVDRYVVIVANRRSKNHMDDKVPYELLLTDTIGTILISRNVWFVPQFVAMSMSFISMTDHRNIYIWKYSSVKNSEEGELEQLENVNNILFIEKMLDIYDDSEYPATTIGTYSVRQDRNTKDIIAIALSEKYLILSRGQFISVYILPHISRRGDIKMSCKPSSLSINCDSTILSAIDSSTMFWAFELNYDENKESSETFSITDKKVRHKDSWMMCWSTDDPNSCVLMGKSNIMVYDASLDQDPKVLATSNGYVGHYSMLEIKVVLLDEIITTPTLLTSSGIEVIETERLTSAREVLVNNTSKNDLFLNFYQHPHSRLWKLLAEHSLSIMDYETALKAYVMIQDYRGVEFCERVALIKDLKTQKAEVAKYLEQYDEAETLFQDNNLCDAGLEMRMDVGDWVRVLRIIKDNNCSENIVTRALDEVANSFADECKYHTAAKYFIQAGNMEKAIECLFRSKDFEGLKNCINSFSEGSTQLCQIAKYFESFNMPEEAIHCYKKYGNTKALIAACANLKYWDIGITLEAGSLKNNFNKIIKDECDLLRKDGKIMETVDTLRRSGNYLDAAQVLLTLAEGKRGQREHLLLCKKLYVLAAYELGKYYQHGFDTNKHPSEVGSGTNNRTIPTVDTLSRMMNVDQNYLSKNHQQVNRSVHNAWRGAAAIHYFILAHRQLHQNKPEKALKTAIRCCEFQDILQAVEVYALIAVSAYLSGYRSICSKAMIKINSLKGLKPDIRTCVEQLAYDLFRDQPPKDDKILSSCYMKSFESATPYHACTITGRNVVGHRAIQCSHCFYYMIENDAKHLSLCSLCHQSYHDGIVTILENKK